MNERDEFSAPVKRRLAERAAYLCSNCKQTTIGPHTEPMHSVSSGVAAHIAAASPKGPRYDPNQNPEARTSISNGIWLCHSCSDLVDKDSNRFPPKALMEMKSSHETFVAEGAGVAPLPDVVFETLNGLSLPPGGGTLSGEDIARLREHRLVLGNSGKQELRHIWRTMQLPESVVTERPPPPAGVAVSFRQDVPSMQFFASGAGSSVTVRPTRPTGEWVLEANSIPPLRKIEIGLVTVRPPEHMAHLVSPGGKEGELLHYVKGKFLYSFRNLLLQRDFFVPLSYDPESRKISAGPCKTFADGTEGLNVREHHTFW